jgi:hypothetical protein
MKNYIRWLPLPALLALVPALLADEPKPERVAVAKAVTETGTILRREAPGKDWQIVKKGEELFTGDLLIGLPWGALESIDGAYRLTFHAEYSKKAPFPILESAVVLRKHPSASLDFFLDRGRVEVTHLRDKADKFTFGWVGKEPCLFETTAKGATVLVQTFARWAPGVPFDPKGGPDHKPVADLIFLVTKGEVLACTKTADVAMKAPPGPAEYNINSLGIADRAPRFVEKLPVWLSEDENGPEIKFAKERLEEFRKLIVEKGIAEAIDTFAASDNPAKVRAAIIAMAASDDIPRLRKMFYSAKSPEVLDLCISVARHWLGRDPSHDMKFYDTLLNTEPKVPPEVAATALQLLHSFDEKELSEVETYQALISYLRHKALGIRGLAYYHLVRLYPEGKKFGFNPAGTDEERAAAVAKWKDALEKKKLPPK